MRIGLAMTEQNRELYSEIIDIYAQDKNVDSLKGLYSDVANEPDEALDYGEKYWLLSSIMYHVEWLTDER